MGALNTAGKVTFLPDDSPFSEYIDISGRAHAMVGRGEGHTPLTPAAPTGKKSMSFLKVNYFGFAGTLLL